MNRIILSGVQSSGKSTLLRGIKATHIDKPSCQPKIVCIEEPIRRLVETENIKINRDGDFTSQMRILEEHHKNTFLYRDFITDRGAVDAFVYAQWSYINGKFSTQEFLKLEEIFLRTLPRYNLFVYLESSSMPVADDIRDVDYNYIKELERLYTLTYDVYLPNTTLLYLEEHTSLSERIQLLSENLI